MIQQLVNNVLASSIIIDGVYYVPLVGTFDELLPLMFAFSMLFGLLPSIGWRVGQGLANLVSWFIDWIKSRKASKAEATVIDPQILEALDRLGPDGLRAWFDLRYGRKTE